MTTAKVGAPKGNLNAVKHGKRSAQLRFVIGELPKPMRRVTRYVREYRRHIEAATTEVHGTITDVHSHAIDEAVTCEQTIGVSRWLLRHKLDSMSVGDVLACMREIRQAKAQRNKAVVTLQLDTTADDWPTMTVTATPIANGGSMHTPKSMDRQQGAVSEENSAETSQQPPNGESVSDDKSEAHERV